MEQTIARAAVLRKLRHPLTVEEVILPAPSRGQVLVKMRLASVCATQVGEINGVRGPDAHVPHLLGHEGLGEIMAVGSGVSQVAVGDQVILHWRKGKGADSGGIRVRDSAGGEVNAGPVTTFSDFSLVSENRVTRIEGKVAPTLAVLLGCSFLTGFGAVERELCPPSDSNVVVYGAGPLGLSVLHFLLRRQVKGVLVTDLSRDRLEQAKRVADNSISLVTALPEELALERLAGRRFDYAIDTTGSEIVAAQAFSRLSPSGRLHVMGVIGNGKLISFPPMDILLGKTISGSNGGSAEPSIDIPKILRDETSARFAEVLDTQTFPLDDINAAIEATSKGKTQKSLIAMPPD